MNVLKIADELEKSTKESYTPEYLVKNAAIALKNLNEQNQQLRNQIKHLEAQVYGGTTK